MSVVRADRRRRWTAVGLGTAAVIGLPTLWSAATGAVQDAAQPLPARPMPAAVLARALDSATIPHSGLVVSTGALSLPDLPGLGQVADLVGGTVRARVWWRSSTRWRTDTLSVTGEQGNYGVGDDLIRWSYEDDTLDRADDATGVRLPRTEDLLPPQLARRLLAGVGAGDRVGLAASAGRVAGRRTWQLQVIPADPHATLSEVDVQVDAGTGLPLAVTVRGPGGGPVLDSRFQDVSETSPDDAALRPPAAPGARRTRGQPPRDLLAQVDRSIRWRPPAALAGYPRTPSLAGRTATYGTGLARFVVVPLPPDLAAQVMTAARTGGTQLVPVDGGTIAQLLSGVLGVIAVQTDAGNRSYLLGGTVQVDQLTAAGQALLTGQAPTFRNSQPP
jgi:hypothetical protein